MREVKIYKTYRKALKHLIISIAFVTLGIWLLNRPDNGDLENIMSWLTIFFFGLAIVVGFYHLFDRRPQIIINEEGIWDRTTKQEEIKWEQIKAAHAVNIFGQKFISIKTDRTFRFKRKPYAWVSRINKEFGAEDLNLHVGQAGIKSMKLLSFIHEMIGSEKENRASIINDYFGKDRNKT
jgi:hypothetical protein